MYDRMHDFNDHEGFFGGGAWWHVLIMVLVIVAIGLLVWFVLSKVSGSPTRTSTHRVTSDDPAVTTLRERLARSEISEEEYRSRLTLLQGPADQTL